MAKIQTRLREAVALRGKNSPRFEIIREGEPLPEIASRPVPKPAKRRKNYPRARAASDSVPHCPLCDGAITRFDMEIYEAHSRCAPCNEALGEVGSLRRGRG